jgi:ABC-type enterobactin transport system permease subunit
VAVALLKQQAVAVGGKFQITHLVAPESAAAAAARRRKKKLAVVAAEASCCRDILCWGRDIVVLPVAWVSEPPSQCHCKEICSVYFLLLLQKKKKKKCEMVVVVVVQHL